MPENSSLRVWCHSEHSPATSPSHPGAAAQLAPRLNLHPCRHYSMLQVLAFARAHLPLLLLCFRPQLVGIRQAVAPEAVRLRLNERGAIPAPRARWPQPPPRAPAGSRQSMQPYTIGYQDPSTCVGIERAYAAAPGLPRRTSVQTMVWGSVPTTTMTTFYILPMTRHSLAC